MTTKTSNNFSGIAAFYLSKFPRHFQMHTISFSPSIARLLCIAPTCYETAATFQSRWLNYNGGLSYSHIMDHLSGPSVPSEKQKLCIRGHVWREKQLGSSVTGFSPHTSSPEASHSAMEGHSKLNLPLAVIGYVSLKFSPQILYKYSNYSCSMINNLNG